jgi:proton-coupled amino acid transporter
MFDMIGFSFYTFEGIGTVLPILKESQNPKNFQRLLLLSFLVLMVYFVFFAVISYMYFGEQHEPIIINNIDPTNFIEIVKFIYCINLVFSYPLSIYPTNATIEIYTLSRLDEKSTLKYWLTNFSRCIVVFLACFCSITFQKILDEFLGLTGALLGIPIILIVPLVCHYKLIAKTKR